jgi:ABC-type sugar transport system substrate-binding protein
MNKVRSRAVVALASASVVLATAAACGGSSSGRTTTPSGSNGSSSNDGASADVAAVTQALAPYEIQPTSIGITDKLSTLPTGKTVEYVECGLGPCKELGDDLVEPLKLLGINLKRVPAGSTPESYKAAFDQTVQDKPDAIITTAIDPETIKPELDQLDALHVPVIMSSASGKPRSAIKQIWLSDAALAVDGQLAADWLIRDGGGKNVKIAYITFPVLAFTTPQQKGIEDELSAHCQSCSVKPLASQPTDIGQAIPTKVVSYLQTHPDTKYVLGAFGAALTGVGQAIQVAGIQGVKLFDAAGAQANLQAVQDGTQAGTIAASVDFQAWVLANGTADQITGTPVTTDDSKLPYYYVASKSNLTFDIKKFPYGPGPVNFQDQFKKLWGVSA